MNCELIMQMLRDEGCQDASVVWLSNVGEEVTLVGSQIDKLQRSDTQAVALNLFLEGRQGFFYTNELDPDALRRFVRRAVETTRLLVPDEARRLADPSRYYRGGGADLHIFDEVLPSLPVSEKIKLAQESHQEVLDCASALAKQSGAGSLVSVETRYTDNIHRSKYLISNGFEGEERSTRCTLSDIVSVRGEGDARPMDGWGQTRLFFRDMPREGLGCIALERTLRKVGERPAMAGRYTMVVESPVADQLLQPLFGAMNGNMLQQHLSFLEGKMDQQVGSPLMHIIDDPHAPGTRGASYFDFDGVATQRRVLFDHGVLRTWFIDTPASHRLQLPPTTTGIHHCYLEPGLCSLQQILDNEEECILVTDFNGGNCNPTTGDFSYGIEGFLYRRGLLVQPVSGMNITGNMFTLWQNLIAVANDADPYERMLIPSLAFADVVFSGV